MVGNIESSLKLTVRNCEIMIKGENNWLREGNTFKVHWSHNSMVKYKLGSYTISPVIVKILAAYRMFYLIISSKININIMYTYIVFIILSRTQSLKNIYKNQLLKEERSTVVFYELLKLIFSIIFLNLCYLMGVNIRIFPYLTVLESSVICNYG